MDSKFDLKALQITPGNCQRKIPNDKSLPRHRHGQRFLKGPVPWDWLTRAAQLGGSALHVGLALWHLAGMIKANEIKLSGKVLMELGVSRYSGYRGLATLEVAGLVSVERHTGRQPVVTIYANPP
jgi:hypothetical protein